jgi:hypothetical protein
MTHPTRAAGLALLLYFVVFFAAGSLGILHRHIQATAVSCAPIRVGTPAVGTGTTADGFLVENWGLLYLFAMPLAAYLMGSYFRLLDNALLTLDDVIKPEGASEGLKEPFTKFLGERFRLQWSSWIFPLSLAAPILLTAIVDGRDILAPLQSKAILPSCSQDWSVLGYTTPGYATAPWYLAFNFAAWVMQGFLGYCGVLVLTLTGGVLGTVFTYGLGDREIIKLFRSPADLPSPDRYRPEWQYCKERCGLEALDVVFLLFVGLSLFALVASAISIFVNIFLRNAATPGSFVLALGTMFFIPLSFFWVFVPYFTHFPRDFPENFKQDNPPCVKPNPWPFGSEKLSWTIVGITASFWLFLLVVLLRSLFPGIFGKS